MSTQSSIVEPRLQNYCVACNVYVEFVSPDLHLFPSPVIPAIILFDSLERQSSCIKSVCVATVYSLCIQTMLSAVSHLDHNERPNSKNNVILSLAFSLRHISQQYEKSVALLLAERETFWLFRDLVFIYTCRYGAAGDFYRRRLCYRDISIGASLTNLEMLKCTKDEFVFINHLENK